MKKSKGFTLLEMVVYSLIFGLSLTGVYTVLIGTVQNYNAATANIEVQQGAQSALNRLSLELREADSATITNTASVGISFLAARNSSHQIQYDASGNLLWQRTICYYLDTDPGQTNEYALFRKEKAFTATTSPAAATAPSVVKTDASYTKTMIARHFASTSAISITASGTLYTITVTSSTNTTGKSNSISLSGKVNVAN